MLFTYMKESVASKERHQKVIEEAPCPVLTPALRQNMAASAIKAAQAVGYRSAGTVEFLLFENNFYFLEMNTRLTSRASHNRNDFRFRFSGITNLYCK